MTVPEDSHRVEWVAAIVALALLAIFVVPWGNLFGPERSVAAYCQIWREEGMKLRSRLADAQRQGESGDIFAPITATMAAPGDLADILDKLEKVAPNEIEPDVKRYRDALREVADSLKEGNLLNMVTRQLAIAAETKDAEERVNTWTKTTCIANAN